MQIQLSFMQVYKSEYQTIIFNEKAEMLEFHWNNNTSHLEKNKLKQELINQTKFSRLYNPKKCLMNTRYFQCKISKEIQDWIDSKIAKKIMVPEVSKIAFIMNDNSYTQISIDQIIDERIRRNLDSQIFNNENEAKKWLLKPDN